MRAGSFSSLTSFSRPRAVVVAGILATVAGLFYHDSLPPAHGPLFFEVTLGSAEEGTAQLYYDTGHGFREGDSVRQAVSAKGAPAVLRFPLPPGACRALRFDPIDRVTTVDFSEARIVDQRGRLIREFAPERFEPLHHVTKLIPHGRGLRVLTGGEDPYFTLQVGAPFAPRPTPAMAWTTLLALLVFLVVFGAVLAVAAIPWRPDWPVARNFTVTVNPWFAGVTLAAIAFKLWLASAQTLYGIGGAGHDDQLFVDQAHELLNGRWLGPYSQFTLMKGPMYSFLLAASFLVGMPFFTTLQIIYAAACLLLVQALRPLAPHRGLRFAIFLVLLFNPVTYESMVHARMLRQNLIPGLALLIVAAFLGLYARRAAPLRRVFPWALLAGIALGAFWLTREESVWILPCAGLLWAATVGAVWRDRAPDRHARLALLTLPALLCLLATTTVAWINFRHYGVFTTCEFKHADFKDGYGALMRVESTRRLPYVPVTRASRERIYAASPAFAGLRPWLEGSVGETWAAASESVTHLPAREREIAGGWFMWALRDAVVAAGHGATGADAMAYYARLAREVNEACDRGLLPAGPRRSGFLPPFRRESLQAFFKTWPEVAGFFCSFDQMSTARQPSVGPPELLTRFADLTRERLGPHAQGAPIPPLQHWHDELRLGLLERISRFYHRAAPWTGAMALLALLAAIILGLVRRRVPFFAVASVGLLGAIGALISAITLIQVTSFPAVNTGYFSGAYGLWLLFMFTGWLACGEALWGNQAKAAT